MRCKWFYALLYAYFSFVTLFFPFAVVAALFISFIVSSFIVSSFFLFKILRTNLIDFRSENIQWCKPFFQKHCKHALVRLLTPFNDLHVLRLIFKIHYMETTTNNSKGSTNTTNIITTTVTTPSRRTTNKNHTQIHTERGKNEPCEWNYIVKALRSTNFKQICSAMSHLKSEIAISFIHLAIFLRVLYSSKRNAHCFHFFFLLFIFYFIWLWVFWEIVCESVNDHSQHAVGDFLCVCVCGCGEHTSLISTFVKIANIDNYRECCYVDQESWYDSSLALHLIILFFTIFSELGTEKKCIYRENPNEQIIMCLVMYRIFFLCCVQMKTFNVSNSSVRDKRRRKRTRMRWSQSKPERTKKIEFWIAHAVCQRVNVRYTMIFVSVCAWLHFFLCILIYDLINISWFSPLLLECNARVQFWSLQSAD